MTTLSTHDTKRVRRCARAAGGADRDSGAMEERRCIRWSRRNARFRYQGFPDRNTEYFLYQTLIGAWPISQERLLAYMEKAVREAKEQTSWTQQNREFEDALQKFI